MQQVAELNFLTKSVFPRSVPQDASYSRPRRAALSPLMLASDALKTIFTGLSRSFVTFLVKMRVPPAEFSRSSTVESCAKQNLSRPLSSNFRRRKRSLQSLLILWSTHSTTLGQLVVFARRRGHPTGRPETERGDRAPRGRHGRAVGPLSPRGGTIGPNHRPLLSRAEGRLCASLWAT